MSEFYAVCFDIRDPKRLRRVANELENYGTRVQKSLFECHLDEAKINELTNRLLAWMEKEVDQVRFYKLCPKDAGAIIVDGMGCKTQDSDYFML